MAQKVNIILIDDIDGSGADETVTFGLDGTTYEIDLSSGNAAALRESLARYVGHARKVTGSAGRGRRTTASRRTAGDGPNPREVRDWARSNGFEVSARGRVPADVIDAFNAAH